MDILFDNIYEKYADIFNEPTIDLSACSWCDPWVMGLVCLKAIEYKDNPKKNLIAPQKKSETTYLKRLHLDEFLEELSYSEFLAPFREKKINEKESPNVHEILHCQFRNDFEARLSSKIRIMFKNFGMDVDDESRATALVGELGNNVFDHNEGSWPTSVRGAIILAQHNPTQKRIEVVVADPGIGFRGSLKLLDPSLKDDVTAIQLGLSGVTGRVGEARGNGLRVIQDWTINKFDGIVRVHSGSGLVIVDKDGQKSRTVFPVIGTLASFVVRYK